MRPIISYVATPTYLIAKTLNTTLKKYLPAKYAISSTDEFVDLAGTVKQNDLLASLNVENIFANFLVNSTIETFLDYSYYNEKLAPCNILKDCMKTLLATCTTETTFRHPNGDLYRQVD